jgi:hypothetical protein
MAAALRANPPVDPNVSILIGPGYLHPVNDMPNLALTLKPALIHLFVRALAIAPPLHAQTIAWLTQERDYLNGIGGANMTGRQFCDLIFKTLGLKYAADAAGVAPPINVRAREHLQAMLEELPANQVFSVINNADLKVALCRMVMSDINLRIFRDKHCVAGLNNLGDNFCNFFDETLNLTLAKTQLYSILRRIIAIPPGLNAPEISLQLIKLFNNKLSSLNDVNYKRLWNQQPSVATDLTPHNPHQQKYLKYKNKYLALKNKML